MAKQQVEVVEKLDGLVERPDFVTTEKIGVQDTEQSSELPRILLLQGISDQVMEKLGVQGEFFHNIAEESLGEEFRFVCFLKRTIYLLWPPLNGSEAEGRVILAKANDGIHWEPADEDFHVTLQTGKEVTWRTAKTVKQSGLAEWGSLDPDDKKSPPAATKTHILFCISPDYMHLGPFVIMLQRTSQTPGDKLSKKLRHSNHPTFAKYYHASSTVEKNKKQQNFYNWKFRSGLWVNSKEEYEGYQKLYEMFNKITMEEMNIRGAEDDTDEKLADTVDNEGSDGNGEDDSEY